MRIAEIAITMGSAKLLPLLINTATTTLTVWLYCTRQFDLPLSQRVAQDCHHPRNPIQQPTAPEVESQALLVVLNKIGCEIC
jgi:hypothetical protein